MERGFTVTVTLGDAQYQCLLRPRLRLVKVTALPSSQRQIVSGSSTHGGIVDPLRQGYALLQMLTRVPVVTTRVGQDPENIVGVRQSVTVVPFLREGQCPLRTGARVVRTTLMVSDETLIGQEAGEQYVVGPVPHRDHRSFQGTAGKVPLPAATIHTPQLVFDGGERRTVEG